MSVRNFNLTAVLMFAAMAANAQHSECAALADFADGPDDLRIDEARFYENRRDSRPFGSG
jgi:hypothetical protein